MTDLEMKREMLKIVNNQLKANDPPCTKDIYENLLSVGYSESEAKDKIGAVVRDEIYDLLKRGQSFDREKYKDNLEEMLEQSIDYEDDHHIETEWDEWDHLIQKGYECFAVQKAKEGLDFWKSAWDVFCSVMEQEQETDTLYGLMDSLDYVYPVDGWLQDYEMELGNAGNYEERIALCRKVLEIFDWMDEDDSCFQCGIGESLFREGKITQAYEHFEKWLAEDPQNINGNLSFSWLLSENGEDQKAYGVIRRAVWGASCYSDNSVLFIRAKQLAEHIGKEDESIWYQQQLDKYDESIRNWGKNKDIRFDKFAEPKQIPVVKEKKIYPNDPCPCGSGKKYKKCCGKL